LEQMAGSRKADAFAAFYRVEFPRLVRTLTLITRNEELAKEAAQDAFIKTYAKWARVSRYDRPDRWVRKVAVRLAIRSSKRERLSENLALQDISTTDAHTDVDLVAAIQALPGRQAAAIALFYLEDRPASEIAEIFECSEATVHVHLHRARKKLGQMLKEEVTLDVG
jgi:RNA polymerase sigma factor (sigma-70 family)